MIGDGIKEDVLEDFLQSLIKMSDKFYINYLLSVLEHSWL